VDKSCWNCSYKKDKQISIFGVCLYFLHLGKEAKPIPDTIVNKGCQYFVQKAEKKEERRAIQMIIEFCDGELLKEKKERKSYKKKRVYKDTRHKYGERKDW